LRVHGRPPGAGPFIFSEPFKTRQNEESSDMTYEEETYPLETLYQSMRAGRINKRELEEAVFQFIFKNLGRYRLWYRNKDDCVDFVCSTYPLISGAIDRYRNTGSSFDAYIATQLRFAQRREIDRRKGKEAFEEVYGNDSAREFEIREREDAYEAAEAAGREAESGAGAAAERKAAKKALAKRQAVLALLKSYYFAGDELIRKVAAHSGVSEEELRAQIGRLRGMRERSEGRYRKALECAQAHYYRCLVYERKMRDAGLGTPLYNELSGKLERARRAVERGRERISKMRITASNQELSRVLGISKGAVDSALFMLRRKAAALAAAAKTPKTAQSAEQTRELA
jgi:hypothetical protein